MPTPETHPVNNTAIAAANGLQHLDPGQLAELRRLRTPTTGAAGFWLFAARHPETIGQQQDQWMAIIRILAILTPKGEVTNRRPLHNSRRRFGEVLCDGGDPGWHNTPAPRPVFSERRLAQLMAARGNQRQVLLERAARAINRTLQQSGNGVNVIDIAWMLLDPDIRRSARRLAQSYYGRLDGAHRDHQIIEEGVKE